MKWPSGGSEGQSPSAIEPPLLACGVGSVEGAKLAASPSMATLRLQSMAENKKGEKAKKQTV